MRTFAELLSDYMARTGISDAELARGLGVRRQTIFRWKEGSIVRPRHREDVLRCADRLRLLPAERDDLLLAAGFPPAGLPASPDAPSPLPPAGVALTATPAQPDVAASPYPWPARLPRGPVLIAAALALAALVLGALYLGRRTSYPQAAPGETLVLVGPFANYAGGQQGYNVAGRVQAALEREVSAGQLAQVKIAVWPTEIRDGEAAQTALARSRASILIWGEYDSGRVLAHFTASGRGSAATERSIEDLISSPQDLSLTINSALPEEVRDMALLTLGQMAIAAGDQAQARAVLTQALARPPAQADSLAALYFWLGLACQQSRPPDLAQAIQYYAQALAAQPGAVSMLNNRGLAYLARRQEGDFDRAVADLTQVIESRPLDAVAYNNRGSAYLQRNAAGDARLALADLDQAIRIDSASAAAYYNRGLAHIRTGEHGAWVADLEQVLALDPQHPSAPAALCWGYGLDAQPQTALPYCERAVAIDPTGSSRDSRGIVYAELGRFAEAQADFQAFLAWLQQQPPGTDAGYAAVRQAWLRKLGAGANPFTAEVLARLRQE